MQKDHKAIAVGISPTCKIAKSRCSCFDCDSTSCFAKRHMSRFQCEDCSDSKSCLFYKANINLTESKSGSLNIKDIEIEITEKGNRAFLETEIPTQDKSNIKQSKISFNVTDKRDKELTNEIINSSEDHSEPVANLYNEVSPSIARLSAKIMDVSYKDFQKSISKPSFPSSLNNISPYDIFSRIKEAYKACSCKVCECLVGKSLRSDICQCKPCECSDCVTFNRNVKSFNNYGNLVPMDNDGCPCIRCDRASCQGIGQKKKQQECDCVGVLKCNYRESKSITRACDCEPCHCIECESQSFHRHRTMIVAPVSEDISRRNECTCNPCECFECGRGFRLTTHLQNEVSTSMNRHPHCQCELCVNETCIPDSNQFCSCERHSKVMNKPFQKDSRDYDIRNATVTYDEAQRRKETNYDTIAMFAAISNTYPERGNSKRCECDQCECLDCKYKNSSKVFKPIQNHRLKKLINNSKFLPSDSTVCLKQDITHFNCKNNSLCGCEECDCLTCDGLANCNHDTDRPNIKKASDKFSAKGDCTCGPCECTACEKLMNSCVGDICLCSNCRCDDCAKEKYSEEVIYPVKKGEKLTPEIFRSKVKDAFMESCINTLVENEEILKQSKIKPSMKKMSAFSSYQRARSGDYYMNGASNQGSSQNSYSNNQMDPCYFSGKPEIGKHARMSSNYVTNLQRTFEPPVESNFSTYSSTSLLNNVTESGSITPARYKFKSWESSCNSSGHDYSNYLVHFPKTTVETCLNDIMQFDNINKNNMNINPTLSSKNNVRKLSRDLYANARQPPRVVLPIRTAVLVETPPNGPTEEETFKYSAHVFDDHPYKPRTFKTTSEVVSSKPKDSYTHELIRESQPYVRHSYGNSNLNSLAENLEYERVQNTLKEAREFSTHLVKLLEKYEKANREFESVTEKIKKSSHYISNPTDETNSTPKKHPSIEDCTDKLCLDTFYMDQVPTKEKQQSSAGSSSELLEVKRNNTKVQFIKNPVSFSDDQAKESLQNIISEPCYVVYETNEGRNESGDTINKTNETLKTITEEREPIDVSHKQDKKRKILAKIHKNYNKMYKRSIICSKKIKSSINSSNVVEVNATVDAKANDSSTEEINTTLKEMLDPFETRDKNTLVNYKVNLPESPKNMKLLKPVNKSTTELRISVTEKNCKDRHYFQKDVVIIKEPMVENSKNLYEIKGDKELSILKKNFCLGTDSNMHARKITLPTSLEQDVKASTQTISKQPNNENATYIYENKALIKLQSEVKRLLDLPILQNSETKQNNSRNILYNNLSKTSSSQTNQGAEDITKSTTISAVHSKNSCDAMKVNFLNVRRVSDHTVLVKWNTPRELKNVQGYELLVDGRAVQKILSPSRRMAVVTCLPHSDKVLLTVRTVVSPPRSGRGPVTTVIYQPKIK